MQQHTDRNSPLTLEERQDLLTGLYPTFRAAYEVDGKEPPTLEGIFREYANQADDEILELTKDFHPDEEKRAFARMLLGL
jgi:hypothetical protein